jgi:hypothetical protein
LGIDPPNKRLEKTPKNVVYSPGAVPLSSALAAGNCGLVDILNARIMVCIIFMLISLNFYCR